MTKQKTARRWNADEDAEVRKLASNPDLRADDVRQLAAKLQRSYNAVRFRIRDMVEGDGKKINLATGWTVSEDVYLKTHFGQLTTRQMADNLNRTYMSTRGRLIKLGLKQARDYQRHKWTEADMAFIREHAASCSYREIGRQINKPAMSVRHMALKHGIRVIGGGQKRGRRAKKSADSVLAESA